jgi:hypothetical protein
MYQVRLAQMLLNTQHEVYISGILSCEMPFIHMSRNALVRAARAIPGAGVTHIMFIDQDTSLLPGTIGRLLKSRKRVIGAVCYSRMPPHRPAVFHFKPEFKTYDFDFPGPDAEPFHVKDGGIGGAAMLIEMSVFDDLENHFGDQKWFDAPIRDLPGKPEGQPIGEDIFFCERLLKAGIDVWVDPGDLTEHSTYVVVCGELFRATRESRKEEIAS